MFQYVKLIIVLNLCLQKEIKLVDSHICNYKIPKISEIVNDIKIEELPPNVRKRRETSPNLRIHFEYQPSFLNSQSDYIIKNILEPARLRLQKLIIPKSPLNGVLRVDRGCYGNSYRQNNNGIKGCSYGCVQTTCINVLVPEKFLNPCTVVDEYGNVKTSGPEGSGIENVDLVLFIVQNSCSGSTIASAASCFTESVLDRPILGIVNLCSGQFEPNKSIKENINVVTHEIIHALGVAVDKYAFYRYDNGTPIVPRNLFGKPNLGISSGGFYMWNEKIIQRIIRKRESVSESYTASFYGFVLPNVLKAVRSHFNCPSLAAVDLEDYGTSGSVFSHFDEYFLFNELMTPQTNGALDTLSNITLALLEDTGWYKIDYSQSPKLDYGYHKGCVLPEEGCYRYMQNQKAKSESLDPFCNNPQIYGKALSCSMIRDYFAFCGLKMYDAVGPRFQYFTDIPGLPNSVVQYYAGMSPYNEYCPVPMMTSNPNFMCDDEYNRNILNPYNVMPSYFGPDSMCFRNDMYIFYPETFYGASCQKYSLSKNNELTITVGFQSFNCSSNAVHNVSLSDGKIVVIRCPNDTRSILAMKISSKITMPTVMFIWWMFCLSNCLNLFC